jgi:hypothetical protein
VVRAGSEQSSLVTASSDDVVTPSFLQTLLARRASHASTSLRETLRPSSSAVIAKALRFRLARNRR